MANSTVLSQKAAIYIRVSTQFQIDKDSMQVQRRELIAYSNLVLGISEYEIFEDPGYSGKNTDRPAYQQMLARLRSGEFSHLLVWKIDRISRNLLDFTEMYSELKKIGVTFVSKNEQFDTSSAIGEAMLKIILVFAELERNMTAERVTAVMMSRASNGQWNGGHVPFGYYWNKEEKTFSINEKEAEVYDLMCSLYEEKQSLLAVCEYLNDHGYTTKQNLPWSPVSVSHILKNVFYMGTYRYNVRGKDSPAESDWITVENHHPALIDDVRFDRLQFMLSKNSRLGYKSGNTKSSKAVHVFSGLIMCGNCGANMTATQCRRRADGWRPTVYGCSSRRKAKIQCTNKYVSDVTIMPFMFSVISQIIKANNDRKTFRSPDDLEKFILSPKNLDKVVRIEGCNELYEHIKSGVSGLEYSPSMLSEAAENTEKEVSILNSTIRKSKTSLQRLQSIYLYGDDAISEADYVSERKRIMDTITVSEKRLSEIQQEEEKLSKTELTDKASYFIMVDKLLSYKPGGEKQIVRVLEPSVLKAFFHQIITRIVITDSKISEITFKNNLALKFFYE